MILLEPRRLMFKATRSCSRFPACEAFLAAAPIEAINGLRHGEFAYHANCPRRKLNSGSPFRSPDKHKDIKSK